MQLVARGDIIREEGVAIRGFIVLYDVSKGTREDTKCVSILLKVLKEYHKQEWTEKTTNTRVMSDLWLD